MGVCRLFQVLDREGQMENPCSSWLADSNWDNITELDKITNFHGIMASFEQYPRDWNLWYTSSEPENTRLPGDSRFFPGKLLHDEYVFAPLSFHPTQSFSIRTH